MSNDPTRPASRFLVTYRRVFLHWDTRGEGRLPELESLTVNRAIIHAVDANAPSVLSTKLLPLQGSLKAVHIRTFLETHARRTWTDSGSYAARFTNEAPESALDHCRAIFETDDAFVPRSQKLADLLKQSMTSHPRITPGNLVVCDCSAGVDRYIGLLKLDVSSGIQRHIEGTEVELLDVPELLPDDQRRLQKAALVRLERQAEFALRVIDRQDGDVVAKFFQEGFLGAVVAFTPAILTKKLYDNTISISRQLESKGLISPKEVVDLTTRLADTLQHTEEFELDTWVPQLPINQQAQTEIGTSLGRKMPESAFVIDKTEADRLRQTFYYVGDQGIKIQFSQESLDSGTVTRDLDADGVTTITVRGRLAQVASPRSRV